MQSECHAQQQPDLVVGDQNAKASAGHKLYHLTDMKSSISDSRSSALPNPGSNNLLKYEQFSQDCQEEKKPIEMALKCLPATSTTTTPTAAASGVHDPVASTATVVSFGDSCCSHIQTNNSLDDTSSSHEAMLLSTSTASAVSSQGNQSQLHITGACAVRETEPSAVAVQQQHNHQHQQYGTRQNVKVMQQQHHLQRNSSKTTNANTTRQMINFNRFLTDNNTTSSDESATQCDSYSPAGASSNAIIDAYFKDQKRKRTQGALRFEEDFQGVTALMQAQQEQAKQAGALEAEDNVAQCASKAKNSKLTDTLNQKNSCNTCTGEQDTEQNLAKQGSSSAEDGTSSGDVTQQTRQAQQQAPKLNINTLFAFKADPTQHSFADCFCNSPDPLANHRRKSSVLSTNSSSGPDLASSQATKAAISFDQVVAPMAQHQLVFASTSCAKTSNPSSGTAEQQQQQVPQGIFAMGTLNNNVWPSQPVCSSLDTQSCGDSSDGSGWNNEIFQAAIQNLDNLSDSADDATSQNNNLNCEGARYFDQGLGEGAQTTAMSCDLQVQNYSGQVSPRAERNQIFMGQLTHEPLMVQRANSMSATEVSVASAYDQCYLNQSPSLYGQTTRLMDAPRKMNPYQQQLTPMQQPQFFMNSADQQGLMESSHLIFNITQGTKNGQTELENATLPIFGQKDFPVFNLTAQESEIITKVYDLAFDQAGCRMIQQIIEDGASTDFVPSIVQALTTSDFQEPPLLPQVMSNQFGNYMCQKIIEESKPDGLKSILKTILPSIFEISTSVHGTRAMQTLAEVFAKHQSALKNEIGHLTDALNQSVVDLSVHPHGNHVIQAILVAFRSSEKPSDEDMPGANARAFITDFIFKACHDFTRMIGMHKHGCCVMQRCLEKGSKRQKYELADVIITNLGSLIEDPYGNYLVQNVLKLRSPQKDEMIFSAIAKDFVRLSQLKFSSNVLEKCLESQNIGQQVDQIFKGTHVNEDATVVKSLGKQAKKQVVRVRFLVQKLMMHQFGNYVLQKAIQVLVDPKLKTQVLESIQLQASSLATTKHGPKVLQKLQKTYPHIFNTNGATASTYEAGASGNKQYLGGVGPCELPQPWRAGQQPYMQGADRQGWSGSLNLNNCYNSKTSANSFMKGPSGSWNVEATRFNINSQNFVVSNSKNNNNVASGSAHKQVNHRHIM